MQLIASYESLTNIQLHPLTECTMSSISLFPLLLLTLVFVYGATGHDNRWSFCDLPCEKKTGFYDPVPSCCDFYGFKDGGHCIDGQAFCHNNRTSERSERLRLPPFMRVPRLSTVPPRRQQPEWEEEVNRLKATIKRMEEQIRSSAEKTAAHTACQMERMMKLMDSREEEINKKLERMVASDANPDLNHRLRKLNRKIDAASKTASDGLQELKQEFEDKMEAQANISSQIMAKNEELESESLDQREKLNSLKSRQIILDQRVASLTENLRILTNSQIHLREHVHNMEQSGSRVAGNNFSDVSSLSAEIQSLAKQVQENRESVQEIRSRGVRDFSNEITRSFRTAMDRESNQIRNQIDTQIAAVKLLIADKESASVERLLLSEERAKQHLIQNLKRHELMDRKFNELTDKTDREAHEVRADISQTKENNKHVAERLEQQVGQQERLHQEVENIKNRASQAESEINAGKKEREILSQASQQLDQKLSLVSRVMGSLKQVIGEEVAAISAGN